MQILSCGIRLLKVPVTSVGRLARWDAFVSNVHVSLDLLLVPIHQVEDYVTMFAARNLHPIWKHLPPDEVSTKDCDDALAQGKSLYHLVNPVTTGLWERYVILRKAAEADFYGTLRATRHLLKLHPVMTQIRDGITFVLQDTRMKEEHQLALADGIIPLTLNVMRSRLVGEIGRSTTPLTDAICDIQVTDVEIFSRIHSATRPTAVDVSFMYRHRTHQNRVEFYCHVFFRVADPITSAKQDRPKTSSQGWERLFEMGTYCDSDDNPPRRGWHPVVQTQWGLEARQLARIRNALFGGACCPATDIDKVDTVRLLLASVGIPYHVARTEDDEDAQSPSLARAIFWEWEYDDWIGVNTRRVCGCTLGRDNDWKRLTYREDPDEDLTDAALERWYVSKQHDAEEDYESSSSERYGNDSDQSSSDSSSGSPVTSSG